MVIALNADSLHAALVMAVDHDRVCTALQWQRLTSQWPSVLGPVWNLLLAVQNGEEDDWNSIGRWSLIPCQRSSRYASLQPCTRRI